MTQARGQLTERIKQRSKELLGYEIDIVELRLMPYIQYVMVNDQKIDIRKCNQEDRDVLSNWQSEGYIQSGISKLRITKEFWNIVCEIVFLSYVDLTE